MESKDPLLKNESEAPSLIANLPYKELLSGTQSGGFSGLTTKKFASIASTSVPTIGNLAA
jgi:hypothetical protein